MLKVPTNMTMINEEFHGRAKWGRKRKLKRTMVSTFFLLIDPFKFQIIKQIITCSINQQCDGPPSSLQLPTRKIKSNPRFTKINDQNAKIFEFCFRFAKSLHSKWNRFISNQCGKKNIKGE